MEFHTLSQPDLSSSLIHPTWDCLPCPDALYFSTLVFGHFPKQFSYQARHPSQTRVLSLCGLLSKGQHFSESPMQIKLFCPVHSCHLWLFTSFIILLMSCHYWFTSPPPNSVNAEAAHFFCSFPLFCLDLVFSHACTAVLSIARGICEIQAGDSWLFSVEHPCKMFILIAYILFSGCTQILRE